ncbi:hypothetical protein KUTeg_017197 [Tegillarca granosa]|uniref:Nucleolar protein 4 n=1 Tax=Tegillarca granosa TaxID=220873 RepID=A0ABQ9EN10_TEGGR|nr:hypothetical protein KUTeg_017197 [Tegillarca granosa]
MSSATVEGDASPCALNKSEMFETFQSWALQNYGDTGKTKTVTRKKYSRIVKILSGDETPSSDNSKFRFWVKAKGFRLGGPKDDKDTSQDGINELLYVPTKQAL